MVPISDIFSEPQLRALQEEVPTPLYFRLYSLLKSAILDGTIATGVQLPTEAQLADTFAVSRITAKRAMDELAQEGLVQRRRGKGTHVIYRFKPKTVRAPLISMPQETESLARESEVKVIECKHQTPPAEIRDALALADSDTALHVVRVRSHKGQPFGYYDSWTIGLKKTVGKREFSKSTRLQIFRNHGLKIDYAKQTIGATSASPNLAKHLDTQVGTPLLSLVRHSFQTRGKNQHLVDYMQLFYHPDRFQYQVDLELN